MDNFQFAAMAIITFILLWVLDRWNKHRQIQRWHDHMAQSSPDDDEAFRLWVEAQNAEADRITALNKAAEAELHLQQDKWADEHRGYIK